MWMPLQTHRQFVANVCLRLVLHSSHKSISGVRKNVNEYRDARERARKSKNKPHSKTAINCVESFDCGTYGVSWNYRGSLVALNLSHCTYTFEWHAFCSVLRVHVFPIAVVQTHVILLELWCTVPHMCMLACICVCMLLCNIWHCLCCYWIENCMESAFPVRTERCFQYICKYVCTCWQLVGAF